MIISPKRATGVLLATFNSEAYLEDQLRSVAKSWWLVDKIIISDDGSRDSTHALIESARLDFLEKGILLEVHANPPENKGVHGNFANLLSVAAASDLGIFFLCDHDDIWCKDKVVKSILALDAMSDRGQSCNSRPALVFTDLEVVSATGDLVATSFIQFEGLPDPKEHSLERLFHQNVVTGCTACFNRALLEVATPVPDAVVMHDHWLGLCAKVFGDWHYIDEPLVRYRQHGSNAVGAKLHHRSGLGVWFDPVFLKALAVFPWHFAQSIEQAKALYVRVESRDCHVEEADAESIREFSSLMSWGLFKRISEGSKWVSMDRGIIERTYLNLVFICLPYLRVRKTNDDV